MKNPQKLKIIPSALNTRSTPVKISNNILPTSTQCLHMATTEENRSIVVGLGTNMTQALTRIINTVELPPNVACHTIRPGLSGNALIKAVETIFGRLHEDMACTLILDAQDHKALTQAMGVSIINVSMNSGYLKTAILLSSSQQYHDMAAQLRIVVDGVIYLEHPWQKGMDSFYQPLAQALRLFYGEPGLVCVDTVEIKDALRNGHFGTATTKRYIPLLKGGIPKRWRENTCNLTLLATPMG